MKCIMYNVSYGWRFTLYRYQLFFKDLGILRVMWDYINKKQIVIIVSIFIVFLLAVGFIIFKKQGEVPVVKDTTNDQFVFYKNLDGKYRDCGSEELSHGYGYNKDMRECFVSALDRCSFSKMHQKLVTVEGDPIFTTVVIDGEKDKGCSVLMYMDSFNLSGGRSQYNTECYSSEVSTDSGQESILFGQCTNGTQHFFY